MRMYVFGGTKLGCLGVRVFTFWRKKMSDQQKQKFDPEGSDDWKVIASSERIFGLKPVRSLEQIRLDRKRQRREGERRMLEREYAERRQMASDRNLRLGGDQDATRP